MLSEQEQKLKDLKDLEEHTRNNLIKIQDDIRELELVICDHFGLTKRDTLQYSCDSCQKFFLISESPF